ncbi:hypothetical protein EYR36_002214 [Pleurotus pulmonarius]|nr:hypothetical protein EYR36_002214 [Pleurotus pulmonarius]
MQDMLSSVQRASATFILFVACVAHGAAPPTLPPQSVFIDPLSFAVLGQNATFRDSAFDSGFNPSSTPTPFFQIFDEGFLDILGQEPSFHEIASNPDFGFANEAPVYVPDTDEIFFSGSAFPGNTNVSNQVNRVSLPEVEDALRASNGSIVVNVTVTPIDLPSTVLSTNGGTGPFRGSLLFVGDGLGARPPAVTLVNPRPPHNATVLLDNFFGRQFNSLNDVKIHPTKTRVVQAVLDGLVRPNGIAFTPDGHTVYVSDSGSLQDLSGTTAFQTQPATIYAFDVDPVTERFINRRVLAYIDAGIPDGLQLDTNGNIYAATGDGVQVFSPAGTLLGKFFVGTRTANMAFAGFGRLILLSETRLFLARINAGNVNLEVLGQNHTFRNSAFESNFNPTSTPPPFFQIFNEGFLNILGPGPSFHEIASNPDFGFAYEAPVYFPETDEMFFSGAPVVGNASVNSQVNKVSMAEVEDALSASNGATLDLPSTVLSTTGGTGPFRGSLLLVGGGLGTQPPAITLVNPRPPHNVTVLLDNFFGRQFNSLDDIKVRSTSGNIFFSDVEYGFALGIRPAPLMPNQIYRLDPDTRVLRMVADGFSRPNGIAFTEDGKTVYVSDSGALPDLSGTTIQTQPATIYAFDVDSVSERFLNRRVFAYIDAGVPDGLQVDTEGNVYAGTGDGVQVWNPEGTLLGKLFVGTRTSNMAFAGLGRLVILSQTKLFLARIKAGNVCLGGK